MFIFNNSVWAQEEEVVEEEMEKIIEENDLGSTENDFVEMYDFLLATKAKPKDLNKITLSELQHFYFLDPLSSMAIIEYRKNVNKIQHYEELQQITSLSLDQIKQLKHYTFLERNSSIESSTPHPFIRSQVTTGSSFQLSRGFKVQDSLIGSRYIGDPQYFLNRITVVPNQKFKLVLTIEKDPGEDWWNNKYGIDFLSASFEYRSGLKCIPKIIVGDYKLQFGQGVALSTVFSLGKNVDVLNLAQRPTSLSVYSSTNEYLNLRGGSLWIKLGNINILPFISYKKLDASIVNDDSGEDRISSLSRSGLHRSISERNNRHRISELIYGIGAELKKDNLQLGGLIYNHNFSIPFFKGKELYRNYYFNGSRFQNVSIFGSYSFKSIYFFGEHASTIGAGTAGVYGLMAALSPKASVVLLLRNYDSEFYSYYSQSVKEAGRNTAEKGVLAGLNLRLRNNIAFSFYSDAYSFPWLRYGVNGPSNGTEFLTQLVYSINKIDNISFRYRFKMWEENTTEDIPIRHLVDVLRQNFRISSEYNLKGIRLRNRLEYCLYQKANTRSNGVLAYQDIGYKLTRYRLSLNGRFTYFNTDNFDAAIYSTEQSLNAIYTIPVFHYNGFRTYFNLKKKLSKSIDFGMRYSLTSYNNRKIIGSGNDIIDGNTRSDYLLQFELKL